MKFLSAGRPASTLMFAALAILGSSAVRAQASRVIDFSGRRWIVKSGAGLGPGPNDWSDSPDNVWIDAEGALHLRITQRDGVWHCAEVYTQEAAEPGLYRFHVLGRPDEMDANAVFALFLYQSDSREADIEFSRWSGETPRSNAQYSIQPVSDGGAIKRFWARLSGGDSWHLLAWTPGRVFFQSALAPMDGPSDADDVIQEWSGDLPRPMDNPKIHINLWLYGGAPPDGGKDIEMVVTRVDRLPAEATAP